MRNLSNEIFFKNMHPLFKVLGIFITGDLVLLPIICILVLITFFTIRFGVFLTGFFILFRYLGEMFYWILAQYGERKYRPHDFGFRKLDNHAIYILYQLIALCLMTVGGGMIFYAAFYMQ